MLARNAGPVLSTITSALSVRSVGPLGQSTYREATMSQQSVIPAPSAAAEHAPRTTVRRRMTLLFAVIVLTSIAGLAVGL